MDEEGRWVTIRGRHVFIKNGQNVSEAIKEYEENKNKTSTTYYRGLTQKYDPNYDKSKLDNPNGYESWTNSLELAKEYAGKNGYVYSVEIPNNELNPDDIYDQDGERSLMYYNDKPVALHGVEGEEFMLYTDHEKWKDLKYKEVNDNKKYEGAKLDFDSDGKDRIVKLSDGSEIKMLDKKDYKRISTEFADSLDEKETKRIQSYVDAPGYSGELNDYDPYDENKKSGTRYLYNTTDEKLFVPHNELNKYYTDMREKYMKEVGTDLNSSWPTDEQMKWAKEVLNTDSYSRAQDFLKEIDRRNPDKSWNSVDDNYYTKEQIDHFKETYEKIKPLDDKLRDYEWDDPEYKKIQDQIKEMNDTGQGIYNLQRLSNIDQEMVVNTKDYDFDQLLKEEKLKYIGAKELKDLKDYSKYQSSAFYTNKENIDNMLNNFNELFDKKGITLDHDVIVFRRGRESSKQIDNGFTMDGIISTSAFDTLPKKMPSGNPFGDRRYYILLPSGTKILLSEQVIGRGYKDDRYEDVWRGVRKQHEILLRPGTHFKQLSTDSYFKGDKYEQDILLLAGEEK